MREDRDDRDDNPMQHPEEQPVNPANETPQFGRLLVVLLLAVGLLGLITWASVEVVTR